MKSTDLKAAFVSLRAEGKSYEAIASEIGVSKSTCIAWSKELAGLIDEEKRKQLRALCESYGIAKEARIRRLGETLAKINDAIEKADFSEADPIKLLDYQLKYVEALKGEYVSASPAVDVKNVTPETLMESVADLLIRIRDGDVTQDQASRESAAIASLLKAYEDNTLKTKLECVENVLEAKKWHD